MGDVVVKAIGGNSFKQGTAVVAKPGAAFMGATLPSVINQVADSGTLISTKTNRFAHDQERIARAYQELPDIAITAALSTTYSMDFRKWAGGNVMIPAGSSITTLTFYSSLDDGNFIPLYDSNASAVSLTVVASGSYPLPDAVFGCGDIKMVGNAAGNVDILLKG